MGNSEETKNESPAPHITTRDFALVVQKFLDREFSREANTKGFKDPTTAIRTAHEYCRILFGRLAAAEDKILKLEAQIAEFEVWRQESLWQTNKMLAEVEKQMSEQQPEFAKLLKASPPALMSVPPTQEQCNQIVKETLAEGEKIVKALAPAESTIKEAEVIK